MLNNPMDVLKQFPVRKTKVQKAAFRSAVQSYARKLNYPVTVEKGSFGACNLLLGDPVYGPKKMPYPVRGGQLLHAFRIGFVHPRTGEEMLFEAPPEERFLMWQRKLKNT